MTTEVGETSTPDTQKEVQAFVTSGRTGRRNALPDILNDPNADSGIAGLSEELRSKCGATGENESSSSSSSQKSGEEKPKNSDAKR